MCTLCDSTNTNTIIEFVPNCLLLKPRQSFRITLHMCALVGFYMKQYISNAVDNREARGINAADSWGAPRSTCRWYLRIPWSICNGRWALWQEFNSIPKGEETLLTVAPELVVPMPGTREEFNHWSTSYDSPGASGTFVLVVDEPAVPLKR